MDEKTDAERMNDVITYVQRRLDEIQKHADATNRHLLSAQIFGLRA
jgi:hypothetical protein